MIALSGEFRLPWTNLHIARFSPFNDARKSMRFDAGR